MADHPALRLGETDSRGRLNLGSSNADRQFALQLLTTLGEEDSPNVGYVRHGTREGDRFGLEPTGMYELMLDNRIAIDWNLGGHPSRELHDEATPESSGDRGKQDLNAFFRFRRNGALVFAYYPAAWRDAERPKRIGEVLPDHYEDPTMFARIGYIPPGAPIERKQYPTRSLRYPARATDDDGPTLPDEDDVEYKTLTTMPMSNVVEISEREYPDLLDTRTHVPQVSASHWPSMSEQVLDAYFSEYGV